MINIKIDENINTISIDITPNSPIICARDIDNEEAKMILIRAIEGLNDL